MVSRLFVKVEEITKSGEMEKYNVPLIETVDLGTLLMQY
jgi:hypothetical protein